MRRLLFASALCAGLCSATNVFASDAESPPEPTVVTEHRWYGWQNLSSDGVALTLFVVAGETSPYGGRTLFWMNPPWAIAGASVFALGGPIVHLAHGHPLRAIGSLVMRAAMSSALALPIVVGGERTRTSGVDGGENANVYDGFAAIFAIFGAAGAVAIDATIMSREEKRVVVEPQASRSFSVVPDVAVRPGAGTLGLRGTF
ncbi:MAG: hypothetical protein ACRELY_20045 [Polyangiaceae bacterium]